MWTIKHWWVKQTGPCHEQGGSTSTTTLIINLSTRCKWFLSFMSWLLYAQGYNLLYPLNRRVSWTISWLDNICRRETLYPAGYWNLQQPAHGPVTILTTPPQLPYIHGRVSKCIITKHSLQLWTILNKPNTGYGCSLWALHNKLSDLGIFKLVLKTGQNSDYNKVFPVDTIMSSQMTEWFLPAGPTVYNSIWVI